MTRQLQSVLLIFLLFACKAGGESLVSGGYQEAVFSVSDIGAYESVFVDVAAWEVVERGEIPRAQLNAWDLPASAGGREVILRNPGATRGYVRLLEFSGVEQQQIRSNAQSWDTGGWFDVNSRTLSMASTFAKLQRRNWQSGSDPVEFSFGPFVVKEWLARGPDGIVMAVIERVAPPLEAWPNIHGLSRLFNATQIVPDIDAARQFYIEKLGFSAYLHHDAASKEPGPNVLAIPHNLATEIVRHVSIVHPQGSNEGSVELLSFDGLDGADFSSRAVPPNLGILMLRFPVTDIMAFEAHVRRENIEVIYAPITLTIEPYGDVKAMAIRGPGGAWLEFFEQ